MEAELRAVHEGAHGGARGKGGNGRGAGVACHSPEDCPCSPVGLHPSLKAERIKLEDQRARQHAEIKENLNKRIRAAQSAFDREKKAAEDEFKVEEDTLRDRFLSDYDERRKRSDGFDGHLPQIRAADMRKMRTRSDVDAGGAGQQAQASKAKIQPVQFALKPTEVHEDLEELQRSQAQFQRVMEGAITPTGTARRTWHPGSSIALTPLCRGGIARRIASEQGAQERFKVRRPAKGWPQGARRGPEGEDAERGAQCPHHRVVRGELAAWED